MKIPTAEEFLQESFDNFDEPEEFFDIDSGGITQCMIEFAQLHVKAALVSVDKACDNEIEKDFINSELILNAYPEDLIK